jgi:hypothetical protein
VANLKKLTAILLAAIMLCALCVADVAYARKDQPADSDFDGIADEYDLDPYNNVFTGKVRSSHENNTTSVSFTVDFRNFFESNTVYQPALAGFSSIGAALAYYNVDEGDSFPTWLRFDDYQSWSGGIAQQVQGPELMPIFGFEDIANYTLNHYGDDDICEVTIGHRLYTYNGVTKEIIAIWVRGTEPKSGEEWSSNFNVGDLARFFDEYDSEAGKPRRQSNDDWTRKTNHRGFDVCATRLLNYLKTYYLDEYVQPELDANPNATVAYWLTGHSRGAAIAGIMASYLIDEGEEIYCYTFASPYSTANTEASAAKYDCIFNLVNSNDFVPTLPMPEWGFTRYGKTAYVDASQWKSDIKTLTGVTYDGAYLTSSDISTMLAKFICITGENADRDNPGKILGWREVYVYHCGHHHAGETNGNYQSSTYCPWGLFGPYETDYYNKYPERLRKYSYWDGGICQTPAYCMQVLVELMVGVANGSYLSAGWNYLTSNKLADKFDFNKQSLISYATKLTEPHFMDTYMVIQMKINEAGNPGARFETLSYYTAENANGGRPIHYHTYTYVPYEGHEPTCEEEGFGYRCCTCSAVNADYYDDVQKNVVIPALGHDWNAPTYEWSADHTTCTAARVCTRDASHVETETVIADYEVVTPPTTSAPGLARCTADFVNEAFETQVLEVELPQLAPTYYTVTFVDWDGTVLSTQQVEEGSAAVAPADPVREGWTFIGWDVDFSDISGDLTVTALYEENVPPVTVFPGDVDCNGLVNMADLALAASYVQNSGSVTPQGILNGDMNGDGAITAADLAALYSLILG